MADNIAGRFVSINLAFNGKKVDKALREYIESVKFTDVSSGSSDSISIEMNNRDLIWLSKWYPTKGDIIQGGVTFERWLKETENIKINYGTFILDSIKFSGSPSVCEFGGLAIPQDQSFKTRQRTKTWERVSLSQIGSEIAGRYGLSFSYNAKTVNIDSLEQTDKTDSDFLYNTVKDYGLKMKVYNKKIVIFDAGRMEAKAPVYTIKREDWVDDGWSYDDELEGTYTGAIIKYKSDGKKDEIKVTVGNANEDSPKARVLYINTKCDSRAEAIDKASAKVNEANESMTKLSGTIWGKPKIASGITVNVEGLGVANGKYYIDKVTTSISSGATKQDVTMHKCYKRL